MPSRQSQELKTRTDWCYSCVNRVGERRFRQLTINQVCQDCDKYITPTLCPEPRLIVELPPQKPKPSQHKPSPHKSPRKQYPSVAEKEKIERGKARLEERTRLFKEQEAQLIQVFNELQSEREGVWWRKLAAKRLGWHPSLVDQTIRRVRQYHDLRPIPITDQIIKFVTDDWQTARQILQNFRTFTIDWVCVNIEKLVQEGRVEKQTNRPYQTLYRLPQIDQTIASKSLTTNRTE